MWVSEHTGAHTIYISESGYFPAPAQSQLPIQTLAGKEPETKTRVRKGLQQKGNTEHAWYHV